MHILPGSDPAAKQPGRRRQSIGDLMNTLLPALELDGWEIEGPATADGMVVRADDGPVRIWLDYETDVPIVGEPLERSPNRLTPVALAAVGRALESYADRIARLP